MRSFLPLPWQHPFARTFRSWRRHQLTPGACEHWHAITEHSPIRPSSTTAATTPLSGVEPPQSGARTGRSGFGQGFGCRPGASGGPGNWAGVRKLPKNGWRQCRSVVLAEAWVLTPGEDGSKGGEEARHPLRVVPSRPVKLGRARIAVAGGLVHVCALALASMRWSARLHFA
jgi:hypothetical protein